jgi:hypothetical protein
MTHPGDVCSVPWYTSEHTAKETNVTKDTGIVPYILNRCHCVQSRLRTEAWQTRQQSLLRSAAGPALRPEGKGTVNAFKHPGSHRNMHIGLHEYRAFAGIKPPVTLAQRKTGFTKFLSGKRSDRRSGTGAHGIVYIIQMSLWK